jgi:hypothetical protein
MATPDLAGLNPLGKINLGGSLGTFASILLVFFISIVVLGLIAGIIYMNSVKKKFWIKIHVFRLVGNVPTRVAIYVAKEVNFGMAGDKLWKVAPNKALGMMFSTIKWIPVGKLQTARNEFWYWIREDGEWINFIQSDIDEISKKAGVHFVKEDMRLQRLATERLLEQRLMNKSFWDKWGNTIMTIIFFLVIAVCMVIIFYQWGKLLDKMTPAMDKLSKSLDIVTRTCFVNETGGTGLIPA